MGNTNNHFKISGNILNKKVMLPWPQPIVRQRISQEGCTKQNKWNSFYYEFLWAADNWLNLTFIIQLNLALRRQAQFLLYVFNKTELHQSQAWFEMDYEKKDKNKEKLRKKIIFLKKIGPMTPFFALMCSDQFSILSLVCAIEC